MAAARAYSSAAFADLKVCGLWDGWESIQNYAIIRGVIPVGERVGRRLRNSGKAPAVIADGVST